ncbi:hypothetical protein I7I53_11910 [Histoplasma capsulatum var. duboisii H88]|uniref:Uncharacterized protein n=1 Tax=Ajellomyces capsulatus (strain H88) TaxID=544711 RepID=A0A8A1LZ33_AJEC8|nr:hypothetical protein I7I53_11910 [Histoplasma capsulatum var. duboisii H88]
MRFHQVLSLPALKFVEIVRRQPAMFGFLSSLCFQAVSFSQIQCDPCDKARARQGFAGRGTSPSYWILELSFVCNIDLARESHF